MKTVLFILLLCAAGYAATGDILSVVVQENGNCVAVKMDAIDTGGVWRFNKGVNNTPTDSTPYLLVKTQGYNQTGARVWRTERIYIDTVYRKNYPNNGFDSVSIDDGDTVWYMHLQNHVFVSDTIKGVSFYKRVYYLGADTQQAYTAETATNNSTVAASVVKPIAKWTWPERSCYDTSFWVSMTGFHESADSGRMLEAVIFSATDNHSHTFLDTITTSVSGNHPYTVDSLKIEEFRCLINTATFTKGDSITVNFKAFPRRGDSLWTGDGVNTTKPTPLYAPQYYLFAEYYCAIVDSINGNDGTGAVTAHDDFVLGAPYNTFLTAAGAINAIRTASGSADVGGSRIYFRAGGYTYFGGTITSGTRSSFWTELINYPGETVRFFGASGSNAFPVQGYIKAHGLTFTGSTGILFGFNEMSAWIDSCFDNRTGGSICYYNACNYFTNCKLNYIHNAPYAAYNDPAAIVRGCEFKHSSASTYVPYCFIGNWNTHIDALSFKLDYAGITAPKPDGSIVGWNRICTNESLIEFYNDSSNSHGLLLINNVFEKTTVGGALMTIASGNNSMDVRHVLEIGDTYVGERQNMYYNDVGLTDSTNLRMRRYCASYNNIYVKRTIITDKDAHTGAAGNQRFGNWDPEWGTNQGSNIFISDPSFISDGFGFNWLRPNITFSNNGDMNAYIKFVDDNSYTGSADGFGDYHLAAGTPDSAFSIHWKCRFDLDGNERDENTAAGAYGYEEGETTPPTITTDPVQLNQYLNRLDTTFVVATGTEPFTYTWQFHDGTWSDTTVNNDTLVYLITPAKAGDSVRCIVSNDGGVDTSTAFQIVTDTVRFNVYSRVTGNGSVDPAGDSLADTASTITYTQTADANNHFIGWAITNDNDTTINEALTELTITVADSDTVTAAFGPDTFYCDTSFSGGATLAFLSAADSIFEYGEVCSVEVTFPSGYRGSWTGAAEIGSAVAEVRDTLVLSMTENKSVTAAAVTWTQYTLDTTIVGTGTVTVDPALTADSSYAWTVDIIPGADSMATVSGDTTGVLTHYVIPATGNKSVTITFDEIPDETPATITTDPTNESVAITEPCTIFIAYIGGGVVTIAWDQRLSGGAWAAMGEENDTLIFTATLARNGAQYRARISNDFGSDTSATATLTVTWPTDARSVVVAPATATVDTGGSRQFTATYYDTLGYTADPQPETVWSSSAGSVVAGLFTAGSDTATGVLVIATYETIADTAIVRIKYPSIGGKIRSVWRGFAAGFKRAWR